MKSPSDDRVKAQTLCPDRTPIILPAAARVRSLLRTVADIALAISTLSVPSRPFGRPRSVKTLPTHSWTAPSLSLASRILHAPLLTFAQNGRLYSCAARMRAARIRSVQPGRGPTLTRLFLERVRHGGPRRQRQNSQTIRSPARFILGSTLDPHRFRTGRPIGLRTACFQRSVI